MQQSSVVTNVVQNTHVACLGGDRVECNAETLKEVCDALVAKHGNPAELRLEPIPGATSIVTAKVVPAPKLEVVKDEPAKQVAAGAMDVVGKVRSEVDLRAARAAGFAPKQTVYERGTRVNETGVDNARRSRIEHDQKPLVSEYCQQLVDQIRAEGRRDRVVTLGQLQMRPDGDLTVTNGQQHEVRLQERAFRQLVSRLGIGGGEYLSECWPTLRAYNVNAWLDSEQLDLTDTLKLRVRNAEGGGREVFAAVSERYTDYDVDAMARDIAAAAPADARGRVLYDGYRAKFEVMFHSDVRPEDYVAGEFFKAGVLVKGNDVGGGAVQFSGLIEQNLCLNLMILDSATIDIGKIRHVGDVKEMRLEFAAAFKKALDSIGHFTKAWGYATNDYLDTTGTEVVGSTNLKQSVLLPIEQVIPGYFNGIIERELVPVRGKRPEVVQQLVQMWRADTSAAVVGRDGLTRAAVVNAFTRYAHEVNQDPWVEDEIQAAAGKLLFGRRPGDRPAPLPYLALTA